MRRPYVRLLSLCNGTYLLAHDAPLAAFLAPFERLFGHIRVAVGAVALAEGDDRRIGRFADHLRITNFNADLLRLEPLGRAPALILRGLLVEASQSQTVTPPRCIPRSGPKLRRSEMSQIAGGARQDRHSGLRYPEIAT